MTLCIALDSESVSADDSIWQPPCQVYGGCHITDIYWQPLHDNRPAIPCMESFCSSLYLVLLVRSLGCQGYAYIVANMSCTQERGCAVPRPPAAMSCNSQVYPPLVGTPSASSVNLLPRLVIIKIYWYKT